MGGRRLVYLAALGCPARVPPAAGADRPGGRGARAPAEPPQRATRSSSTTARSTRPSCCRSSSSPPSPATTAWPRAGRGAGSFLLYNRRHLGVTAFLLALVHGAFALIQFHAGGNLNPLVGVLTSYRRDYFLSLADPIRFAQFPFEIFGLAALGILFATAATSHDFWLKNLGASFWKLMHMLIYLAYALLLLHVFLGALQSERSALFPALLGAGFAGLITLHLVAFAKEKRLDCGKRAAERDGFIPDPGTFEFGVERTFEGTLFESHLPVLQVNAPGARSGMNFLLVGAGKFGAPEVLRGKNAQRIRFKGSLIHRNGMAMIEVNKPGSIEVVAGHAAKLPPVISLGAGQFIGELVDTKCFLGVMRPATGKVHRACAIRCLSGGAPPGLLVRDDQGNGMALLLAVRQAKSLISNPTSPRARSSFRANWSFTAARQFFVSAPGA